MDQYTLSEAIMPKNNDAALAAFISAKIEIDAMLARLSAQSYGRKLVTHGSGGFAFVLDPVAEFNSLDDFGQAILSVEFAPFLLG